MTNEKIVEKLENHEVRISNLEQLDDVVSKLVDTVDKTNDTADKTNKTVEILYDTIQKLQQSEHDRNLLKEHSFLNHVWKLVKQLSLKDWISLIIFLAGVIVAIQKLL